MAQTLTISDELFERLQDEAKRRGLARVEDLLEQWLFDDLESRREAVRRIDRPRDHLARKYGESPNSTGLIREDRER